MGQVVFLRGLPGAGKSHIVGEFAQMAKTEGFRVISAGELTGNRFDGIVDTVSTAIKDSASNSDKVVLVLNPDHFRSSTSTLPVPVEIYKQLLGIAELFLREIPNGLLVWNQPWRNIDGLEYTIRRLLKVGMNFNTDTSMLSLEVMMKSNPQICIRIFELTMPKEVIFQRVGDRNAVMSQERILQPDQLEIYMKSYESYPDSWPFEYTVFPYTSNEKYDQRYSNNITLELYNLLV